MKKTHGDGGGLLEAKSSGVQPLRLPYHALVSTQCSNGEYASNRNIKQEPLSNMATVYSAIRRDPLQSTRWTLNNVRREDPQRQKIQKRTTGCNGEGKRGYVFSRGFLVKYYRFRNPRDRSHVAYTRHSAASRNRICAGCPISNHQNAQLGCKWLSPLTT